ncbi:AraC family transcriptional regulator [Parabacteroides chinchillae]|uniref:AraC-type DNA-binding protein n=1 Tax=Parabacteroides chinchillae TaxID=871327 RepID=A0A8G2F578_9BACT|nr:AraC family transcriptional regulator [Parabacteroides chinchillae]SEG16973.1 AraC-type DNA-binding protein [Parabacteroides chinchillae]
MNKESDVLREITPLSTEDCFLIMQRLKQGFKYPLHIHPEFELNYLENASGAIRIVGDSIEEMDDLDLVLIAGNTKHAYSNHNCFCKDIFEITIQFHHSLFDSLINKRHFKTIKDMFEKASQGLIFSKKMIQLIQPELKMLSNDERPDSFHNLLKLIDILKTLSLDSEARRLNAVNKVKNYNKSDNDRLEGLMLYLHENYYQQILLSDAASLINMSEASLNRFLKKWTGKTFIDNLNDIRIAEAACRLIDTSDSISEICYKSGFNNLSNFNRIFKSRKGNTPTEYREKYARTRFRI